SVFFNVPYTYLVKLYVTASARITMNSSVVKYTPAKASTVVSTIATDTVMKIASVCLMLITSF
ncbi:hypothetical protein RWG64_08440, partial [Staphylococcus pseudintermedius]|nr:hypothetical protein [Staphylococcus pseudintermedius]